MDHTAGQPSRQPEPRLGVDFGGVIIPMLKRAGARGDTRFDQRFLSTPAQPGALGRVAMLVAKFEGRVWIVSKAGSKTEELTRTWLDRTGFLEATELLAEHVLFCREREEKEPICRELGITHFVDDRIHIMQILRDTVANLYLFGKHPGNCGPRRWATLVANWDEAAEAIFGELAESNPREVE